MVLDKGAQPVAFADDIEGFRQSVRRRTVILRGFGNSASAKRREPTQVDVVTLTATRDFRHGGEQPGFKRLGRFAARLSGVYSVRGTLTSRAPSTDRVRLRFTWYDREGRSTSELGTDLGHVSGVSVHDVDVKPGEAVDLNLAVRAPELGETAYGVIEFAPLPRMGRGESLVFDFLRVQPAGIQSGMGRSVEVQGSPSPTTKYDENPVENFSFEAWQAGQPRGWAFEGEGPLRRFDTTPFGDRALLLDPSNEDDELLSNAFAVREGDPLCYYGWVRFDERARFRKSHRAPIFVRFFNARGRAIDDAMVSLGDLSMLVPRFGDWLPIVGGPFKVPKGAVTARAVVKYDDTVEVHYQDDPWIGGSGMMLVDNILVFHPRAAVPPSDFRTSGVYYAGFARLAQRATPAYFPLQAAPATSLMVQNYTTEHGNLFDHGQDRIEPRAMLFNLLPIERDVALRVRVVDWDGRELASFDRRLTLSPYELRHETIAFENPGRSGPYKVLIDAEEAGQRLTSGTLDVAVLPESMPGAEELASRNYPYWMYGPNVRGLVSGRDSWQEVRPQWEFMLQTAKRFGVKGVRISLNMHNLDYEKPEVGYTAADRTAEVLREIVSPAMARHGLDYYVSVVDQMTTRNSGPPRSAGDREVFANFVGRMFRGVPRTMSFVLFGNEGVTRDFPKRFFRYRGNAQTWAREYTLFREAAKAELGDVPVGPGQAGDVEGNASKKLLAMFPGFEFDVWGVNCYHNEFKMGANLEQHTRSRAPEDFFIIYPEISAWLDESRLSEAPLQTELDQALSFQYRWSNTFASEPKVKVLTYFAFEHFKPKFPLFHSDHTPRMVVSAFAGFASMLGAGEVVHTDGGIGGDFVVHTFRKDSGDIVGLAFLPPQNPNERSGYERSPRHVRIDTGAARVEVADMFGNPTPRATSNGVLHLVLTERPQFILGAESLRVVE